MLECMEQREQRALPEWQLIQAFLAVMECGTLSAAARRLGATQPTLGRQIRQLEAHCGDILFLRRRVRLEPTDRALDLYPAALEAGRAVHAAAAGFGPGTGGVRRKVRFTLPTLLADAMLPALLPDLLEAVPEAQLELLPSDRIHDLERRDADIALRLVAPRQPDLIARRLGTIGIGLFAARHYVDRRGMPQTPAALAGHRFILPADDSLLGAGLSRLGLPDGPPPDAIRTDDLRLRHRLLRAGLGIATCHDWLGRQDPELVPVLPGIAFGQMDVWLVTNQDVRRSATLRRIADLLPGLVRRHLGAPMAPTANRA
jgi:DNA-binding transcriptional LysR family regulator